MVRMMGDGGNILHFHGDKCIRCLCKISPEDKVPLLENNWQISRPARFVGDEVRGYERYLESCLGGSFRMGECFQDPVIFSGWKVNYPLMNTG